MPDRKLNGICFFGGYEEGYPRTQVLRKGLMRAGTCIAYCNASPKKKVFKRYAVLLRRYISMDKGFDILFVPVFRHKDVPLAWLLARITGKKVVFDPLVSRFETKIRDRGDAKEGSFQSWYNRLIDRVSLKLPDMVLADTEAHARMYSREFGVPEKKLWILPVGFDDTVFGNESSLHSGRGKGENATVLFFGSYLPLHGTKTIVEAAELLRNNREIRFRLIGDGQTFEDTKAYSLEKRLENVEFLGRIPYEELPKHIAESEICLGVFGTGEKTMRVVPNKIFQCMSMGKPVITAVTEAIKEIFVEDAHVALVPPGDARALARKIEELHGNAELRERIAGEGKKLVVNNFTTSAIAKRFIEVCEKTLR